MAASLYPNQRTGADERLEYRECALEFRTAKPPEDNRGRHWQGEDLSRHCARADRLPFGLRALCTRAPRLLHELSIAHGDGSYAAVLQKIAKADALVFDPTESQT